MRHEVTRGIGAVAVALGLLAGTAHAQFGGMYYPGGFGGYGWSQWGADPGAGYLAGAGAYARGQGVYNLMTAQAQAIQRESLIKWNKALMAQKKITDAEKARKRAARQAEEKAVSDEALIEDGTTLNRILDEILEFNPDGTKAAAAKAVVTADLIRDIPFRVETDALTVCLDQMTGRDGWPLPLSEDRFAAERQALATAVDEAVKQDLEGPLSDSSANAIRDAVAKFQKKFADETPETSPNYDIADSFLRSLGGLAGMLQNPKIEPILAALDEAKGNRTIGELIAFMHSFNLRFAPAESPRQKEIYRQLALVLSEVRDSIEGAADPGDPGSLPAAAPGVFRGLSWEDLQAHDSSAK